MNKDIIHLLSDAVANQIAAGEVIQRPASVVKELLENAIDSRASAIQLIIKDSGKTLIQVVDNGIGMSFHDSRLCFERHATSKITSANDLFSLTTKGFRGEALASIAAIAHVELKTKRTDEQTGTHVVIEGSTIKTHEPTATQDGTSIAVKNLFFNVPARRNFLKSDTIEYGHIEEEFYRVALIHTDVAFTLAHNGKTILQLQPSNFKQRIVNIFGSHLKEKLFPTEQNTDIINISGFIAKPENAKKRKSEQYLFINQRFVRHSLLNYAIETAYSELIPTGYKPAYFVHLEIDPVTIDVNISPTKVEVKLQDERLVFGFLNSCVKKSLGELSLTPRLDFDYERGLDVSNFPEKQNLSMPSTGVNPNYTPFATTSPSQNKSYINTEKRFNMSGWEDFLQNLKISHTAPADTNTNSEIELQTAIETPQNIPLKTLNYFIIKDNYLVLKFNNELRIVDILNGQERILYELYYRALSQQAISVQKNLFPETISLSTANAELLLEVKDEFFKLGYDIEVIDNNRFAINGTPNNSESEDIQELIENFLDYFKANIFLYRSERNKNIAYSLAKQKRSYLKPFSNELEVSNFIQQLIACEVSDVSPSGKKIFRDIFTEELAHFFNS